MRRYLAETDVRFAVLFGSRVRGDGHESSDVDVALRFPDDLSPTERFRRRNRIDADLQSHADAFVDVSDIEDLPVPIARAALRDGIRLVGDDRDVDAYRERVEAEYEETATERSGTAGSSSIGSRGESNRRSTRLSELLASPPL
ncbi:nucleotidyltransferase domain-containing protein [Halorubrum trapanicum]|uniref:type VII toxin-antitoxin system MntA family adenylyltransferase antitoxin n=1 Tax=Halorubrum trapanicum TaxID=29284 RepID=UPI001E2AD468|nr:nucleotidyltransferase domain-containing protein [Halorubrum trapanicum]